MEADTRDSSLVVRKQRMMTVYMTKKIRVDDNSVLLYIHAWSMCVCSRVYACRWTFCTVAATRVSQW